MIKNIAILSALSFVFACGAPQDEGLTMVEVAADGPVYTDMPEQIDEGSDDIGTAEQPLLSGLRGGTGTPTCSARRCSTG